MFGSFSNRSEVIIGIGVVVVIDTAVDDDVLCCSHSASKLSNVRLFSFVFFFKLVIACVTETHRWGVCFFTTFACFYYHVIWFTLHVAAERKKKKKTAKTNEIDSCENAGLVCDQQCQYSPDAIASMRSTLKLEHIMKFDHFFERFNSIAAIRLSYKLIFLHFVSFIGIQLN